MTSFFYQYGVTWCIFLAGCWVGVQAGELTFSGEHRHRLLVLVVGMCGFTLFHAVFTPWGTW
jgi:hypothetical protein